MKTCLCLLGLLSLNLIANAQNFLDIRDENGKNTISYRFVGLHKNHIIVAENGCLPVSTRFKDKEYKLVVMNPATGQNRIQLFFRMSDVNFVGIDSFMVADKISVAFLKANKNLILFMRPLTSNLNPRTIKKQVNR